MSIKLVDTLEPMADFPAVEAKDVAFNDNGSLQEKYDNEILKKIRLIRIHESY